MDNKKRDLQEKFDSLEWAEELGSAVRPLPKATPELNAMATLWEHTEREAPGDREAARGDRPVY